MEAVQCGLMDKDEALRQLTYHIQRAQGRMKDQTDHKRKEINF